MPDVPIKFGKRTAWLSFVGEYRPGDMPPSGYNDWHEWARVQHKDGLRQKKCDHCGKWKFPQEISSIKASLQTAYRTKRDAKMERNPVRVQVQNITCKECEGG